MKIVCENCINLQSELSRVTSKLDRYETFTTGHIIKKRVIALHHYKDTFEKKTNYTLLKPETAVKHFAEGYDTVDY